MKHKISTIEFCSLLYFTIRASFMGITSSNINFIAHESSWMATILGAIVGILPLILIIKIMNYKPELNILEKNKFLFGNTLGNIINILLSLIVFTLSSIVFYNLCIFISSQYLNKTPVLSIAFLFGIGLIYVCSKGIVVLNRTSLFLLFIGIIFVSFSILGLTPTINLENFKPFISNGIPSIFKASYIYITYNILPIFILTIIPKNKIECSKKFNKSIIITYILANFTLWNISFSTIGTLGIELLGIFEYPEFHVLKYISIFGTSSRFDSLIFIYRIFDIFILICISSYFISKLVTNYIKCDKKLLLYTTIIILLIASLKLIKNITNLSLFVRNIFSIIMFISISLLIIITNLLIKIKSTKT